MTIENALTVLFLAVMGEAVIEAIKPAIKPVADRMPSGVDLYLYISLILGVILAVVYNADILAIFGFAEGAGGITLGEVLTGLVIGRGSNFVHDLLNRIQGVATKTKAGA